MSVGHSSMIVATILLPPLVTSTHAPQLVTVLKPFEPGIAAKYVLFAGEVLAMFCAVSLAFWPLPDSETP